MNDAYIFKINKNSLVSDRQSWGVDLLAGRSAADGSAAAHLLYRQKSIVWILLLPQDNFFFYFILD